MPCAPLQPLGPGVGGPVVVVVMDGVGLGKCDEADAVFKAKTPCLDALGRGPLATQLAAHGTAVGMSSDADMGNSEVGHNAMGAGRVFDQGAKLVGEAVASGSLFQGAVWKKLIARCAEHKTPLHLLGLLSDGNVHSHIDHVLAMVRRADAEGLEQVYLHILLDGRDVPKTSALEYVDKLEACLRDVEAKGNRRYRIASGGGRMTTTMDRYQADWDMVKRGWEVHVLGEGRAFSSAREAVETLREETPGIADQNLGSFVLYDNEKPVGTIEDGSSVIAFNFRGDRMLEMTQAFEEETFAHFERKRRPDVLFAGMMLYDGDTQRPKNYLVSPPAIDCTLGELLCDAGVTQLACSETQKFGHVTYFWNGNRSGTFNDRLERYIEIPSLRVPFDSRPEMKAPEIVDVVLKEMGNYRFTRINLANGDMVGHTGNFEATVRAMEVVDTQIQRLNDAVVGAGGALVVTADHGNADDMAERDKKTGAILRDEAGRMVPKTSHSLNPVPLYIALSDADLQRYALAPVQKPGLGHLAATCATLLGFAQPEGYEPSLLAPKAP